MTPGEKALGYGDAGVCMAPKTKLLDQMRAVLRLKHMSFRNGELKILRSLRACFFGLVGLLQRRRMWYALSALWQAVRRQAF
jgi:hypothetical protein